MALVGMHPVLTHVPPNRWRSMTATDMPAVDSLFARVGPACPVPMMIASYFNGAAVEARAFASALLIALPSRRSLSQRTGATAAGWCIAAARHRGRANAGAAVLHRTSR